MKPFISIKPDKTIHDKDNNVVYIVDVAIPNTHNIQSIINEKLSKYTDLAIEIKKQWKAHTIHIIPIVLSSTGIVPKNLHKHLDMLQIPTYTIDLLQKAVILNTCRIVRKFLSSSLSPSSYII